MSCLRVLVLSAPVEGDAVAATTDVEGVAVATVAELVRLARSPRPPDLVVVDGRGAGDGARRLAREVVEALPGLLVVIAGGAAADELDTAPSDRFHRDELLLLRQAVETMQIGVTLTDLDGRIIYSNPAEAEMHGYQPGELAGLSARDLAPSTSWRHLSSEEKSHITRWRREGDNLRRDGSSFPVRLLSDLVTDTAGEPLGIVTTCEDISDRVRIERELRTLRQAVESMDLGLTIADPDGRIVYTNPAEARMHGYDRDDLIGAPASVFAAAAWSTGDGGALDLARSSTWRRETVNRRRDGSVYPVQLSSVPVTDPDGRLVGLITTSEDITARKKAEDELRLTKEAIERLHTVARTLQRCDDEAEVRAVTLTSVRCDLGLERCLIGVLDGGRVTSVATSAALAGLTGDDLSPIAAVVSLVGPAGSLAVWDELERSPCLAAHWPGFRSMVAAALAGAAVFVAVDEAASAFSDHQIHLLELLLGHASEALRRVRLEAELRRQATCDPLTGVRNRRFFSDTIGADLERSRRADQPITFLMIDIDRFKEINDRFGHQTGDRVLTEIAELFTRQVRRVDSVVRYGGDEFLVVLVDAEGRADTVVERIEAELATWNATRSPLDFAVTLSVGHAVWDPSRPVAVNEVLAAADQAMYAAKRAREGRLDGEPGG